MSHIHLKAFDILKIKNNEFYFVVVVPHCILIHIEHATINTVRIVVETFHSVS